MFTVKRKFPCYLFVANSQHNFYYLNVLVRYQFFIRIQTFFFDFKKYTVSCSGKDQEMFNRFFLNWKTSSVYGQNFFSNG